MRKFNSAVTVSVLEENLKRRLREPSDPSAIIGTEIRLNRKLLDLTLKAVADETCSISYVSKIETNSIDANVQYLREICKKVNIDDTKLEDLKNSYQTCLDVIDALFDEDYSKIEKIYNQVKTLKNFRHLIIDLYYFYNIKDYNSFNDISSKISEVSSTLSDIDLILFVFILAKYCYVKGNTLDSLKLFKYLIQLNIADEKMQILIYVECMKCLARIGSLEFFTIKEKLVGVASRNYNTHYLDISFKLTEEFKFRYNVIRNIPFLFAELHNQESDTYKVFKERAMSSEFISNICLFFENKEAFKVSSSKYKPLYVIEEYLLDYLLLKDGEIDNSVSYLLSICLPEAYKSGDLLFISFFKYELQNFYFNKMKYKRFVELEEQYRNYIKKLDFKI